MTVLVACGTHADSDAIADTSSVLEALDWGVEVLTIVMVISGIRGVFIVLETIQVGVIPDACSSEVPGRTSVLVFKVEEVAVRSSINGADDG